MKLFPKDFFWGAATAAYQVEGGIENCDWAEAARDERVPVCGIACDHYNRYEEDFDIAKSLGHTAHRFSVEWARIEPEEGKFDGEAIAHYREVLKALHERGIKPYITLWHFTLPLWFSKEGGFERKDSAALFSRYCGYVVHQLGDLCDNFATMNEPNVFSSNGYLRGSWPPFHRFALTDMVSITNSGRQYDAKARRGFVPLFIYFKVLNNLADAHNTAYRTIKKITPKADVSVVKQVIVFDGTKNIFYRLKARLVNYMWTYYFMNKVVDYCDSIGLNYYLYVQFGDTRKWKKTDMDWNFAPKRIYDALMMLKKYNKPLYVTESGVADHDDSDRAEYIEKQVAGVWRAIKHGAPVYGHFYWSLLDNYEWALGFEKRFGLVEVDFKTQKRTIRSSAYVYKKIIQDNGLVK